MNSSVANQLRESVEGYLAQAVSGACLVEPLLSACQHAVFPGGKRIRPLFSLLLCGDIGGEVELLSPSTAALELVHCASLVHDDLPAIDNDLMRRGRPSCHSAFGEASAVLAGDALVGIAHLALASSDFPAKKKNALHQALARAIVDISSGQQLDIMERSDSVALWEIHRLKTGALFRCSATFACLASKVGGAMELVENLGLAFGLYFQLVDDYLDIYGDDKKRGREGSSDKKNGRYTLTGLEAKRQLELAEQEVLLWMEKLAAQVGGSGSLEGTSYLLNLVRERLASVSVADSSGE